MAFPGIRKAPRTPGTGRRELLKHQGTKSLFHDLLGSGQGKHQDQPFVPWLWRRCHPKAIQPLLKDAEASKKKNYIVSLAKLVYLKLYV